MSENTEDLFVPNEDAATETSTVQSVNGMECPICKRVFSNQVGLRMHHVRKHTDKNWDTGKNFRNAERKHRGRGKPWTPEQHAKFKRTMRKLRNRKQGRIQIVYPDTTRGQETPDLNQLAQSAIRFCPHCGENIEKHL